MSRGFTVLCHGFKNWHMVHGFHFDRVIDGTSRRIRGFFTVGATATEEFEVRVRRSREPRFLCCSRSGGVAKRDLNQSLGAQTLHRPNKFDFMFLNHLSGETHVFVSFGRFLRKFGYVFPVGVSLVQNVFCHLLF